MRKVIKLLAATVIAAAPVIGLTAASPAHAAVSGTGCAGNGFLTIPTCSGLDPLHSYNFLNGHECSTRAYTVLARHVLGGYLELRWGPYCQTNWTRFTPGNNDEYEIDVVNATTGVWAGSACGTTTYGHTRPASSITAIRSSPQIPSPPTDASGISQPNHSGSAPRSNPRPIGVG